MGKQSHTPGPWTHDEGTDDLWVYAGAYPVCRVRSAKPDQEDWANARLIAAAPDMLALLRDLIDIEGPQPGTSTWATKVLAVIAKATK